MTDPTATMRRAHQMRSARTEEMRRALARRICFDLRAALAALDHHHEDHMATPTRPYVIRAAADQTIVGIIRATSPAQAMRHHVRSLYSVAPAGADDAFEAAANGIRLEVASVDQGTAEGAD